VSVEGNLEISVVEVGHEFDVVREQFLVPAVPIRPLFDSIEDWTHVYPVQGAP
jgi:hypothetical protein